MVLNLAQMGMNGKLSGGLKYSSNFPSLPGTLSNHFLLDGNVETTIFHSWFGIIQLKPPFKFGCLGYQVFVEMESNLMNAHFFRWVATTNQEKWIFVNDSNQSTSLNRWKLFEIMQNHQLQGEPPPLITGVISPISRVNNPGETHLFSAIYRSPISPDFGAHLVVWKSLDWLEPYPQKGRNHEGWSMELLLLMVQKSGEKTFIFPWVLGSKGSYQNPWTPKRTLSVVLKSQ